jgi:nitric oxide dioxygenase
MNLAESVERITREGNRVTGRFYEVFFERNPEARAYFRDGAMAVQSVMLTMALTAVRQHPKLSQASEMYLRVLGTKHSRQNVPAELYPKFGEALLDTFREFHGEDWDDGLSEEWRAAFERAVELMREGYLERFHI